MDRVGEEANEDTIDKIARIEAVLDKIAGDEAINDNTIDPFVELVVLAADRVGEETDEDIVEKIVINSSIEATVDNIVDPLRRYKAAKRLTKKLRDPGSNPASPH